MRLMVLRLLRGIGAEVSSRPMVPMRLLALFSLCSSSVFPVRRWFEWRRPFHGFWLKANGLMDSHGHCPDKWN